MFFPKQAKKLMRTYSPFLFVATLITAIFMIMGETPPPVKKYQHVTLSTVTGYFLQDDPGTEPKGFDYTTTNFGLKPITYSTDASYDPKHTKTQWERFTYQVNMLNHDAEAGVSYKVLYMGRHGEGYHNVAEAFYGTHAWDCYWSLQSGNTSSTWLDALLTPVGESQALAAHAFWSSQIATQNIPLPEIYYASPLRRCLATCSLTFSGLPLPADRPFVPIIKEMLREANGAHTCDQRSSKSVIKDLYPSWTFEEGFQEQDKLWRAEWRETDAALDQRTKGVLGELLGGDEGEGKTWISISSHSGQIASALRVLNHRSFPLGTGQVIPVLVKVTTTTSTEPPVVEEPVPWEKVAVCAEPPK